MVGKDQLPALAVSWSHECRRHLCAHFAPGVAAARKATTTIPIVFAAHADPVGVGHLSSLARLGGNVTGLTMLLTELVAKSLEIFKEAAPHATRMGVLWDPTPPAHTAALKAVDSTGERLEIKLLMLALRTVYDLDGAFSRMMRECVGGFLALASSLTYA